MAQKKFKPPPRGIVESKAAYDKRVKKAEENFNKTQRAANAAHKKHGPLLGGGNLGSSTARSQTSGYSLVTCGTCAGNRKIVSGDGKSSFNCPSCSGLGQVYKKNR